MVVDHMGEFIPGMPDWLRVIGRLAAPIFLFLIGWSCEYTHDLKRFLGRLYAASIGMAVLQVIFGLEMNIFRTLFQVALVIALLKTADTTRQRIRNLLLYTGYQVGTCALIYWLFIWLPATHSSSWWAGITGYVGFPFCAVIGSVFYMDYGIFWLVLGVAMWAVRDSRLRLSAVYLGLTALFGLCVTSSFASWAVNGVMGRAFMHLPDGSDPRSVVIEPLLGTLGTDVGFIGSSLWWTMQGPMVFALPFMLPYNHRRGPKCTWFFYVFYPAHILALHGIGMAMGGVY